MSATGKFITTVPDEFLKDQFKNNRTFQQVFETYDVFEKRMHDVVRACPTCGCLAWKGCTLPCDCTYKETLKK